MIWLVKLIFSSMKNCSIFLFEFSEKILKARPTIPGEQLSKHESESFFSSEKLNNFHYSFCVLNFAFLEASFVASMSNLACLFQVNSVQQFTASLRETSPQTMI